MPLQAKDLGQLRESVTLTETARAGYPGAAPRVAAICDLRAAEAYACDRADTDCRRALDSAFDRLGDAPSSSEEPGWCYWLDEAQAHAMAGFCYLRLHDWSRARQHLRTALHLQDLSCACESRCATFCWPRPTCVRTGPKSTTPFPWPPKRWRP